MKIALITGCSGLIGSESVKFFIEKGFEIVGIDNHMRGYFFGVDSSTESSTKKLLNDYDKFKFYNIDIRDYGQLEVIFKQYCKNIEVIIHTAAQPSHDWASKEPMTDFSINAVGTLNLLELTRLYCQNAAFIFTSTNKVYGDSPNKLNYHESEKRYILSDDYFKNSFDESLSIDNCLHSLFGASKLSADILVQEYGKYFGMNTVCFRGGCLTGPNHLGTELHGFLSYLIHCIVNKKKYTIYGYKGKQVRDNIHSWDLVNIFWYYYQNPKSGEVYNVGGGIHNSTSILEAIDNINKICSKNIDNWIYWNDFEIKEENRIGDHIYYVTNLNKLQRDFPNWQGIKINLHDLLEEMVIKEIKKL